MKKQKMFSCILIAMLLVSCIPTAYAQAYIPDDPIEHVDAGPAYKLESKPVDPIAAMFSTYAKGDHLYENGVSVEGQVAKIKVYDNGYSKWYESFVRYLTATWSKASDYSYSEMQTASWQTEGNISVDILEEITAALGFSKSISQSFSVSVTIPADETRYSKLGLASDFYHQFFLKKTYLNGNLIDESEGSAMYPTDMYLKVYYKA